MENFARQCKKLIDMGKQIVLVSSGAQVSGVSTLKEWARKKDVHFRQALCAIGQVELMSQWRKAFASQNIHIGQLLFTKDDFENNHRSLNLRNTIFTLVDEGVIPIINENDSVSTDEFSIGNNLVSRFVNSFQRHRRNFYGQSKNKPERKINRIRFRHRRTQKNNQNRRNKFIRNWRNRNKNSGSRKNYRLRNSSSSH